MILPSIPDNETQRLAELHESGLLDSMPEQEFNDVALLASQICHTPIALMTLVDSKRQWFKSRVNFEPTETSRDLSFCAHAINRPNDVLVVPDATADPRFSDNPLVTSDPSIRFYAGAPLVTPSGAALGALCVIDRRPRELSSDQEAALRALGRQAMSLVELRRARGDLERAHSTLQLEKSRSDQLLHSIFPEPVAQQLKADVPPECVSRWYSEVTVVFADLEGFWQAARDRTPEQLIDLLNKTFTLLDSVSDQHGLDRLKTIGDMYMGIAGLRDPSATASRCTATAAAEWALDVQREIASFNVTRVPFSVRIGMNTGPVVAGVVGRRKIAYDVWGPTVNLASELQASGVEGTIQVSETTCRKLSDRYLFEPRGEFYVRGIGDVTTYLLKGRKSG